MTAIPQPMSDRIVKPLRDVLSRQWNVLAATGVVKTLAVSLSLLLATALLLGSFAAMPAPLRVGLAALAWLSVALAAAYFLRPALRRRTIADAAFAVERHTPNIHERLSSTVELSGESGPFAGSPALLRHLARQAESDAAAVRPDQIIPADALRRWAIVLAPLLLLWLGLAILFPRPLFGGLYRTLMPWKSDLPAMLARVLVTPGDVTIAEGDALDVKATVNDASGSATEISPPLLLTQPVASPSERPLARDLQRLAPRDFQVSLTNLRDSFRYRVTTGHGDSPWFTATVLPRPAVAALDVRYDYPPYTGIDPLTVPNADGNLRALQGTDVTLTVHASDALDLGAGKSRVAVTEGSRQRTLDLKPVEGQPNVYEARLTLFNSGSYRIHLANRHGLTNKEDPARSITAEFDQPPKVAITAPQAQVTVRADDDVPVLFNASDDFGVAKVRAVVQVDDKAPAEFDVPALPQESADRRQVDGMYPLSVATHLGRAGVEDAKTITYWLKATDNRDPDPQSVESARQTLKIDRNQDLSYRARIEQEQAKDLIQAIDKAIQRLNQSEGQVNSLKSIDAKRAMNADEMRRSDEQRDHLATTAKDLGEAAESNLRTAFRAIARKAQEVAEGPIQSAAESVARSRLNADQAEPRKKAAEEAVAQVVDARKQLEELKKKVEARGKEAQSARELEKLAEKQRELAEQQAKAAAPKQKPDAADKALQQARQKFQQRQRELLDRLNHTIGQDESLRDAKAVEQAVRLRELIDRVQQIQKDQTPLQDQVAKQQQVAAVLEQSEDLAKQQQKLNEEIEVFSEKQHAPLQKADAKAPEPQHQAGIVDRLRKGEVDPARQMQKQSAEQLQQVAQKLKDKGNANDLKPDPVQQNALALQEQAKQADKQAGEKAKAAADKLKQAKAASNAEQAAAAQKDVTQAAEALKKQAEAAEAVASKATESDDATAKKNGDDAKKAADAAEAAADAAAQAAQAGNADQAMQKLSEAATQLATARQKAADAIKADFLDDQRDASKVAADQAKDLADRQKALADAAKANAQALAKAKENQQSPQDVANRQNQLKDQTNQAKQQAEQLEQLAKSIKSPVAERVEGAKKFLDEAAAAEAQAAQGEQANAQAQQQAAAALQQAGQADQQAAQLDQQAAQAAGQAESHEQQAQVAQQNAAAAEARADPGAAQAAKQQAEREKQQVAADQKRAKDLEQQSAAAEQRAKDVVKQADAAQDVASAARRKTAEQQAHAQEALARAEDVLRDVDRLARAEAKAKAARAAKPDPADANAGEAQPASDAQANGEAKDAGGAPDGQSPPAPLTAEQALQQAAQGAQEAAQAQQQAANGGNDPANALDASRQAAAALEQAAQAMAAAAASPAPGASDSVAGPHDDPAQSQGLGKGEKVSAKPGETADSRHGIGVTAGGLDERPQSVQQLGISAGDWARLGPLTQRELLNAAQQNGPPAYREMIKNYYVRIARLDRDGARAGSRGTTTTPREQRDAKKK